MRSLNYYLLDVFTEQPFGGNPLAVFPDGDGLSDEYMQQIAQELNLSETTFIQKARNKGSDCTVRIFTPKSEIPIAGHPTIGTAHAILKYDLITPLSGDHLTFDLGVGPTKVDYQVLGGEPTGLFMHQPIPELGPDLSKEGVARALSLDTKDIVEGLPVQVISCGVPFICVPLRSLEAVKRASLRLELLDEVATAVDTREVFVFSTETEEEQSDVHCRMFAPRFGIIEDAATGSAHGPLGGYLMRHGISDGRSILSEQGFEMGRPSRLHVKVETDTQGEILGVGVGGQCVPMGKGEILRQDLDAKESLNKINYQVGGDIRLQDFVSLLQRSSLGARRPIEDLACLRGMLRNSNLIVSAWSGGKLVGIARAMTDFHYACYLSDLAVDESFQNQGIGTHLQKLMKKQLMPKCKLILISAPDANQYYPAIGYERSERCWVLPSTKEIGRS